jgi:ferrous iron transport protein A
MKLRDLAPGNTGELVGFDRSEQSYRDRLLSMGLTKGVRFTLLRVAPLGDPVEIELRGFKLSLRKAEADVLLVRRVAE